MATLEDDLKAARTAAMAAVDDVKDEGVDPAKGAQGGAAAADDGAAKEPTNASSGDATGSRSRIGATSDSGGSTPVTKRYPAVSTISCIEAGAMTRVSWSRRWAAARNGSSGRR